MSLGDIKPSVSGASQDGGEITRRGFITQGASVAAGLAALTAAMSPLRHLKPDDLPTAEEFLQKHYKEMTAEEKKAVLERIREQVRERYGVEATVTAPPPMDGLHDRSSAGTLTGGVPQTVSRAPTPDPAQPSRPLLRSMPWRHRLALGIATSIPLLASLFAFSLGPSPEKRLAHFYDDVEPSTPGPGANSAVPKVLIEVAKKDMPRRREAIRFIAESRARSALPVLETIVQDEGEPEETRADALKAISSIDPTRGREVATLLRGRAGVLGKSADALIGL